MGARLALALFSVVLGAFGLVYLVVVPSLERRLIDAKLSQLDQASEEVARSLPGQEQWQRYAEEQAGLVGARVVIFRVDRGANVVLQRFADSQGTRVERDEDPLAQEAAETLTPRAGTRGDGKQRFAEVARPVPQEALLVLSDSLEVQLGGVELVERRLVQAGLLALALALLGGYGAAWLFARRIRRLERAANRIAGGRFDEPVVDAGADEVGELATAFERMRLRLAQLDHARREFIANASHELRTPLFSLSGFLELLREEDLDEETKREFLETMREQVTRLTRLATDLLDLTRLDAGRLHVEREEVDLADLAQDLVSEFRALAMSEGRRLEVQANGPARTIADEQRLLQVGRILIENALVHTPSGTRVRVRAGTDNGRVLLAVEDDGPGIPPDQAEHVFERFYRVDGAKASGSGLGLAIARELAEAMGGEIRLESRAGRTVFTVAL